MPEPVHPLQLRKPLAVFGGLFLLFLLMGAGAGLARTPAYAQEPTATPQAPAPPAAEATYAGPDFCANCHEDVHAQWSSTRHSQAFSSPIFQQNWEEKGNEFACLQCHTTGYDADSNSYAAEGVTCESCHGPFIVGHPEKPMPFNPSAELCATCHKTTTDEWRASPHGAVQLDCQSCHNPHSQKPKAESVTALCTNCHNDPGQGFAHSTHANSGLECSNCHMYTAPTDAPPIGGLIPTGHTFTVGSEACINCHQDTVHTRDTIVALTGGEAAPQAQTPAEMEAEITSLQAETQQLESSATSNLYAGLVQGAIIGLVVGGTGAWIVSKRLKVFEVEEEGDNHA
jgi:predicted CXXCH cytochrome family protein